LPKSKTSTAQNQTQLQGDNIWNYHAQLSQVLHSFRTSESRLRGVMLPMGPTGVIVVDIIPCILYVIQDMQEGDMLCGRYGPYTPQIQRQSGSCNVDYEGLACHKRKCKYLYADPMHSITQSDDLAIQQRWSQHGVAAWKEVALVVKNFDLVLLLPRMEATAAPTFCYSNKCNCQQVHNPHPVVYEVYRDTIMPICQTG
jgi:hypothetical protein